MPTLAVLQCRCMIRWLIDWSRCWTRVYEIYLLNTWDREEISHPTPLPPSLEADTYVEPSQHLYAGASPMLNHQYNTCMQVPHKGGDRIHVTMRKLNRDMIGAIDRVHRTTTTGLSRFQTTVTSTLVGNWYRKFWCMWVGNVFCLKHTPTVL